MQLHLPCVRNMHRTWGGMLHLLPLPDVATSVCIYSMLQCSIRQQLPSNWGGCSPGYQALLKAPRAAQTLPPFRSVTRRSTCNSWHQPGFPDCREESFGPALGEGKGFVASAARWFAAPPASPGAEPAGAWQLGGTGWQRRGCTGQYLAG